MAMIVYKDCDIDNSEELIKAEVKALFPGIRIQPLHVGIECRFYLGEDGSLWRCLVRGGLYVYLDVWHNGKWMATSYDLDRRQRYTVEVIS